MKNRKYGKTWQELRQDHTVKVLTVDPRANGWYYCPQTGQSLRQGQILAHMMQYVHGQTTTVIRPQPKAKPAILHPSGYRNKNR